MFKCLLYSLSEATWCVGHVTCNSNILSSAQLSALTSLCAGVSSNLHFLGLSLLLVDGPSRGGASHSDESQEGSDIRTSRIPHRAEQRVHTLTWKSFLSYRNSAQPREKINKKHVCLRSLQALGTEMSGRALGEKNGRNQTQGACMCVGGLLLLKFCIQKLKSPQGVRIPHSTCSSTRSSQRASAASMLSEAFNLMSLKIWIWHILSSWRNQSGLPLGQWSPSLVSYRLQAGWLCTVPCPLAYGWLSLPFLHKESLHTSTNLSRALPTQGKAAPWRNGWCLGQDRKYIQSKTRMSVIQKLSVWEGQGQVCKTQEPTSGCHHSNLETLELQYS